MNIRSTDFKSVVSAYSTIPAELLYCTYWHSFPLLSVTFQNFWRDVRRDADDSGLYQFAGTPVKSRVSEKQRRSPSRDFKSLASAYSAMPALLHTPSCPLQASRRGNGWRWIRTTEAICSRFTVCPLWPLGNPSMLLEKTAGENRR